MNDNAAADIANWVHLNQEAQGRQLAQAFNKAAAAGDVEEMVLWADTMMMNGRMQVLEGALGIVENFLAPPLRRAVADELEKRALQTVEAIAGWEKASPLRAKAAETVAAVNRSAPNRLDAQALGRVFALAAAVKGAEAAPLAQAYLRETAALDADAPGYVTGVYEACARAVDKMKP